MDSDMKTLVYENYNKFISASETIHQVPLILFYLLFSSVFSLVFIFIFR